MPASNERNIDPDVFDFAATMDLMDQNKVLFGQIRDLFFLHLPLQLKHIQDAVAGNDAAAVQQTSHKLKGSISTMVARRALDSARRLEMVGRSGDMENAPVALAELEMEINRLYDALKVAA